MILFVRENCIFCEKVKDMKGLTILQVHETSRGPMVKIDDTFIPLPSSVTGLPALLDREHLYIGENPITDFLVPDSSNNNRGKE